MKTKEADTLHLMRKIVRASTRIEQQEMWMEEARRKQQDESLADHQRHLYVEEVTRLQKLVDEDIKARMTLAQRLGLNDRFRGEKS